jgi:hypothetical protein
VLSALANLVGNFPQISRPRTLLIRLWRPEATDTLAIIKRRALQRCVDLPVCPGYEDIAPGYHEEMVRTRFAVPAAGVRKCRAMRALSSRTIGDWGGTHITHNE